jgi:GT2 family glycosyltransferase
VTRLSELPLVTVVTPVYRTDPDVLKDCLLSCYQQTDQNFVHVVVDNGSNDPVITKILDQYQAFASNAVVISLDEPLGIAGGTQRAIDSVSTDYIAFLDHDDELTPDAVATCNQFLTQQPGTDVLYSDWDSVDLGGNVTGSFRKPAWSLERLRGNMYLIHLLVVRRELIERVGGFSSEFDGSQDHDLMLRVSELAPRVEHIPRSLYRWRAAPGSVVHDPNAKPYATESGKRAIEAHCQRMGLDSRVTEAEVPGYYRHERRPSQEHKVSFVIPTAGKATLLAGRTRIPAIHLLRSILSHPLDMDFEFILVTQPDSEEEWIPEAKRLAGADRLKIVEDSGPGFNFSRKVNLGAATSSGDILAFLNDDVEVLSPNWLNDLVAVAEQDDVGAVGALLLFEDGRCQHAGHVYIGGLVGHAYYRQLVADQGMGALYVDHEVSGVTAACLVQRREVWEAVGGFSEIFPNNYNDVDYCLKIRELGYRIVLCANTELLHYESLTRLPSPITDEEFESISSRWSHRMSFDRYVR